MVVSWRRVADERFVTSQHLSSKIHSRRKRKSFLQATSVSKFQSATSIMLSRYISLVRLEKQSLGDSEEMHELGDFTGG